MIRWHLGENRYFYTTVTSASDAAFTITSSNYTVYDTDDESIITSGIAVISSHTIYTQWEPSEAGIFVADFDYVIGDETFTSRQVIEVVETV